MDEQKDRLEQQGRTPKPGPSLKKKLGPRGKGVGMTSKDNDLMPIYIITKDGKEIKLTGDKFFEMKSKGGRVGLKSGSKGCKLAMKGKGKAYGKNS